MLLRLLTKQSRLFRRSWTVVCGSYIDNSTNLERCYVTNFEVGFTGKLLRDAATELGFYPQ